MAIRHANIYKDETIAAGGSTFTKDLPKTFITSHLCVKVLGANVTNEATLAEVLAGIGSIRIQAAQGQVHLWEAEDLYYFNQYWFNKTPYLSNAMADTDGADDDIRNLVLVVPFNPLIPTKGPYDVTMGLGPSAQASFEIVTDTDTVAGSDGRKLTVTAIGQDGVPEPQTFMGAKQTNKTPTSTGDNYVDIQGTAVNLLMGCHVFATTSREDLTTADAPGLLEIGWAVQESMREKISADHCHAVSSSLSWFARPHLHTKGCYGSVQNTGSGPTVVAEYYLWDIGLKSGIGVPYQPQMQIYMNNGVAELHRVYPLLAIRNKI